MLTVGGNGYGKKAAAAGTKVNRLVPPRKGLFTRVSKLQATAGTTAHTVTALRPLGRTTTTAAAAGSQAVVALQADPQLTYGSGNPLAANDLVAVRETDGVTRQYVVSAVPGSYPGNVTLTGNLVAGAAKSADVWAFGVASDADPRSGESHQGYAVPASAQATYEDRENGVTASLAKDEPVLLQDDNSTVAGSIDLVAFGYTVE